MTSTLTLERVQAIVTGIAGVSRSPTEVGPDTRLATDGLWLDSVHLLEVVIACEEEFGVVFDPQTDFTDDKLRTVRTFFELIRAKRTA